MTETNGIPPEVSDAIIPATSLGLSRLGWIAPTKAVSFDQWLGILDAAMAVERASPFWIGDLVNYAMAQGKEFEERAFQAMPYKDQTLRNYAVIARLFPPTQRRGNLTIRHHAAVAKIARKDMSEAQRLLERAEIESLSASDMAKELMHPALPAPAASETANDLASEGEAAQEPDRGNISDGYHTFNELYDHRITLFIALCRKIRDADTWRSRLHSDGTMFEGQFVMGIFDFPGGQITYHLPLSRWDETEFVAETLDYAPKWDGHSPSDVIERLKRL